MILYVVVKSGPKMEGKKTKCSGNVCACVWQGRAGVKELQQGGVGEYFRHAHKNGHADIPRDI